MLVGEAVIIVVTKEDVPAVTVCCCVAAVNTLAVAVTVGVPTRVSLYLKLALLLPFAIVTLLTTEVPSVA